jgi:hypothetical protein
MQQSGFLVIAQDAAVTSPGNLVVLGLTILGASLTFGKDVISFLQSRVKQSASPGQPAFRVLCLRMESASQSIEDQQRMQKDSANRLVKNALLGSAIITLSIFIQSSFTGELEISSWIVVLAGTVVVLMIVYSVLSFLQARKLRPGQPTSRRKSVLIVQANLDSVAARCQLALASLQAITVEDTRINSMNQSRAMLQGGTGGWPNAGQRVTIRLRQLSHGRCFVLVESASFHATIGTPRQNSTNVLHIIRHLVD